MTRARDSIVAVAAQLAASSDSPDLDAELLVAHVLGASRPALAADPDRRLGPAEARQLEALAARRAAGEPLAYLTGWREFWSLELEVTPDVLVPRPETELLVEWTLQAVAGKAQPSVLDLGTGSGAIALAVARERADAAVTAVDSSAAALQVAHRNAARLGLGRVQFVEGRWFGPARGGRFDVIVSNPPYVAAGDPALAKLTYEPSSALVAGEDGLDALSAICTGAGPHLAAGGSLIVEHGASQGEAVRGLMTRVGLAGIETRRDLAGLERATRGNCAR